MLGLGSKEETKASAIVVPGFRMKGDAIAGRYRIEKLLGVGSSGFVVAARHVLMRRPVTVKVLTSGTGTAKNAQRRHLLSAHLAATLKGENIARVVDTGFTEDGLPFIATEHLEGRTLAEELTARTQIPTQEAVGYILQVCEGLAEAHREGIVHGDLKPQNLFLTSDGVVKVLDFGMTMLATEEEEEASATWFASSPAYLAPEQLRQPEVDARADIWAVGVILHQLVAGRLPFDADTVARMFVAVAYDEPALLAAADVPYELAKIVHQCLAKSPASRPADVATLARLLRPFAGRHAATGGDLSAPSPIDAPPPPAPVARPEPVELPSTDLCAIPSSAAVTDETGVYADEEHVLAFTSPAAPPSRATGKDEPDYRRRRLGAIGVAAAAAVLAVAGLLAQPASAEAASIADEPSVLGASVLQPPADLGVLAFVPSSFALPEREEADTFSDGPASAPFPVAVLPPPSPRAQPVLTPTSAATGTSRAAALPVREDPRGRGFTHPGSLRGPARAPRAK